MPSGLFAQSATRRVPQVGGRAFNSMSGELTEPLVGIREAILKHQHVLSYMYFYIDLL